MLALSIPSFLTASAVMAALGMLSSSPSSSSVFAAAASTNIPCIESWTGPSADNSFDCTSDSILDFLAQPEVAGMFVPFAIGILWLIPFSCLLLIGRYCCNCCGSSKMRPSSFCGGKCCGTDPDDELSMGQLASKYSTGCIRCVKLFTIVLVLLAAVGVILSYVGGLGAASAANDVSPTIDRVADWAVSLVTDTKAAIANPDDPTDYPADFDITMFDDVEANINQYRDDAKKDVENITPTVELITKIIGIVSVVPGVVLLIPIICAICNIRLCLPILFILLSYILQFIYFFFTTVLFILAFALTLALNDFTNENASEKSIMQWYLIPYCDAELPLQDAKDNIDTMESTASVDTCTQMATGSDAICSPSTSPWAMGNAEVIFDCEVTAPSTDCPDFAALSVIINAMAVKSTAPAQLCGASVPNTECTLRKCAESCTDATTKGYAAAAVAQLDTAVRIVDAYEKYIEPYMSCNALLQKVMDEGVEDMLTKLRNNANILKVGTLLLAIGTFLAVIIGFLGQKRFINKSALMADDEVNYTDSNNTSGSSAHDVVKKIDPSSASYGGIVVHDSTVGPGSPYGSPYSAPYGSPYAMAPNSSGYVYPNAPTTDKI